MKTCKLLATLFLPILLATMVGCNKQAENPPYYKEVYEALGEHKSAAAAAIGISENSLEFSEELLSYKYTENVVFLDREFAMYLLFDGAGEGPLYGVRYVLTYEDTPREAAQDAISVFQSLEKSYGIANNFDHSHEITSISELDLETLFTENKQTIYSNKWILTDTVKNDLPFDPAAKCYVLEMRVCDGGETSDIIILDYRLQTWID